MCDPYLRARADLKDDISWHCKPCPVLESGVCVGATHMPQFTRSDMPLPIHAASEGDQDLKSDSFTIYRMCRGLP